MYIASGSNSEAFMYPPGLHITRGKLRYRLPGSKIPKRDIVSKDTTMGRTWETRSIGAHYTLKNMETLVGALPSKVMYETKADSIPK